MRLLGHLRTRLIVLVLLALVPMAGLMFHTASEERRQAVDGIKQRLLALAEGFTAFNPASISSCRKARPLLK
jgi:hypothetical protein